MSSTGTQYLSQAKYAYYVSDTFLQGGSFLLTLVQDAAQYAPVPYLQEAAGSVLYIFNAVSNAKNNKEDLRRLANDALSIIVAIWRSYQLSSNKNDWPSRGLRDIILDLVMILDSIVQFVKSRMSKSLFVRVVYNALDSSKVAEYRQRLNSAVQTFQVSSDLSMNEMLQEMLKKQDAIARQMQEDMRPTTSAKPYIDHRAHSNARHNQVGNRNFASEKAATSDSIAPVMDYLQDLRTIPQVRPSPMSFNNIHKSGISIGGGSIHIHNDS